VTARDDVEKTEGEIVAPFVVDAPPPVVSSQLEIRGLHFALSEGGPALDPAVVKRGSTSSVAGTLAACSSRGRGRRHNRLPVLGRMVRRS